MVPKCKAGWQGSDLVSGGLLGGGGGSKRQVASDAWFQNAKQGGRGLIW